MEDLDCDVPGYDTSIIVDGYQSFDILPTLWFLRKCVYCSGLRL
jgi:hypothetical protein